jgi:hypothetical protein
MAIIIPIGVDTSGLKKLNTAGGKLRAFGKIAAVAAGAAALGGLVKTLQVGTAEFMENQKVVAQTNAVLKSTRGIAKVTGAEIESLAESLMMKSGVDDEAIQSGQNLLLTFTNIRNEVGKDNDIFNQATKATLDLSVAMGKDMTSAAILVGKALNDPVKGATALTRAGVQLSQAQKDQITAFVESGRVLEAQKIILAELTTQFGGSAEAAGKTLPGQLNILKQTFNNLAGDLVARFMPSIARAATALIGFIQRFADAPTLKARVEVITDSIGGVFRKILNWWSTGDRKELPARVILTPPGRVQIAQFFVGFQASTKDAANRAGQGIGREIARGFFGGFSAQTDRSRAAVLEKIVKLYRGDYVFEIGAELARGLWQGFTSEIEKLGLTWPNIFRRIISLYNPTSLGVEIGNLFRGGVEKGASNRRAVVGLANAITRTVRDAVQTARGSLTGAAGTLGGLVSEIIGGTSPEAKRLREIRSQQAREAREREDARLREAVANAATSEERAAAEQDLQDFLLEQEAIRLEESIQNQQDAANRSIADLVESFNQGLISAEDFSAQLNGLIGANRGEELGIAFAGAFNRELQTILNTARDIFSVIGTGEAIAAGGAGIVSDVLKGENQRRFDEALAEWQTRKQRLDDQLKTALDRARGDDSPGGKKITDAEKKQIDKIRATIEQHQKRKPNRGAYGLAMGGILKQPTFVAGEAGKEAVIPLESSSAAKLLRDALGGGGGSSQVINLTVNAGLGTNPDELSRVIVDSIKYYERRNGQVFTGPLVTSVASAGGSLANAKTSGPTDFNRIVQRRRG